MNCGLKEKILGSLITGLFVIMNIVCFKYTTFLDMTVSVRFIIYPIITLCLLLLWDSYDNNRVYSHIIGTSIVSLFIALLMRIILKFDVQNTIFDLSGAINTILNIKIWKYIIVIIAFIISNFIMITISDYFKKIGHRFIGVTLGIITSIIMFGLISTAIYNNGLDTKILLDLLISDLIINMIMSFIMIGAFYLFKEKNNIYNRKCFINEINYISLNTKEDKNIIDIINMNKKESINKEKKVNKKKKSKKISKKSVNE